MRPLSARNLAITWVIFVGLGLALVFVDLYVARLVATAILLAAGVTAIPWIRRAGAKVRRNLSIRGRDFDLHDLARRSAAPMLLTGLTCWLHWPLLLGQMPASGDHRVHLARAWIFSHELVGRGRLSGWSSVWFAGFPTGQEYPPGVDLWITLFRVLHLGLPDPALSYTHGYLAFAVAGALAFYWLGLRATASRGAALLAALLWLVDPGAWREGGWAYTFTWGVWAQSLGLVAVVVAICALDHLLDRPRPAWMVLAAAATGFAILAHPMSVITLSVFVPLFALCRWLRGPWPREGAALCLGVALWGLLLSAWWLVPFIDYAEWTFKIPAAWRSMDEAMTGVFRGAPFERHWPIVGALAVLGAVIAMKDRRPLALSLALGTAVLLFVSTTTAFEELRLEDVSASFGRLMFQRFAIPAKVGWFVLAATGAAAFAARLWSGSPADAPETTGQGSWRRLATIGLASLVMAPFVVHGVPVVGREVLHGVGDVEVASDQDAADYRRFLAWSRERWDARDGFYRIAYIEERGDHFMADAPVYNHTPAYRVNFTPCTTFIYRPEEDDPRLLRALAVRYVVSRTPLRGVHLEPEVAFGDFRVYRLRESRSDRYTLEGPGTAEVLQFDEERIRIRVDGATEQTRLTVHVAHYADWRASLTGSPLRIETAPAYADRLRIFMRVAVPRDGVVEFRFVRPPLRVAMQALSGLALLLIPVVLLAGRSRLWRTVGPRLARAVPALARGSEVVVVVGVCAALTLVVSRWTSPPRTSMTGLAYAFAEHLDRATAVVRRERDDRPCEREGRELRCGPEEWASVGLRRQAVDVSEAACIWAHPYAGAALRVTFPDVPLGQALVGRHAISDFAVQRTPEGAPVRLEVSVEDGPARTFVAPNALGWSAWRLDTAVLAGEVRDVTFTVTTEAPLRRHYCFDGGVRGNTTSGE